MQRARIKFIEDKSQMQRQFAWRTEFRDTGVNRMAISDMRYVVKVT